MTKHLGSKAFAFALPATLLGASAIAACATDNGSDVYGPTYGPLPEIDAGGGAEPVDGASPGPDAGKEDAATEDAGTCGTIAVLAGGDAALTGAVSSKAGTWTASPIAGGGAKSKPALVALGAGFVGVTHGPGDALSAVSYAGSWDAPKPLGSAGVKGAPTLTVVGTAAHVVYAAGTGAVREFLHGVHDGAVWNAAAEPVANASTKSFGTVSAAVAGAGSDLVFAENGTNHGLYVRSFATAWTDPVAVVNAGTVGADVPATPELVAIDGKYDLLLVYAEQTTRRLSYAVRDAASKAWVDKNEPGHYVHTAATTNEKLSLTRLSPTSVLVAFRGQDGNGYFSHGTIGAGDVTWSSPASVGGGATQVPVDSTPAVAKGVCGDDAIVVYASDGAIAATRLKGTAWSAPETIAGASGARVAVATR